MQELYLGWYDFAVKPKGDASMWSARGILCVGIWLSLTPPAFAEEVVGQWCDSWRPNSNEMNVVITILEDDGDYSSHSLFFDGSERTVALRQTGPQEFREVGSSFGDGMRFMSVSGDLTLFDNDGPFRVARPLSGSSTASDCIPD